MSDKPFRFYPDPIEWFTMMAEAIVPDASETTIDQMRDVGAERERQLEDYLTKLRGAGGEATPGRILFLDRCLTPELPPGVVQDGTTWDASAVGRQLGTAGYTTEVMHLSRYRTRIFAEFSASNGSFKLIPEGGDPNSPLLEITATAAATTRSWSVRLNGVAIGGGSGPNDVAYTYEITLTRGWVEVRIGSRDNTYPQRLGFSSVSRPARFAKVTETTAEFEPGLPFYLHVDGNTRRMFHLEVRDLDQWHFDPAFTELRRSFTSLGNESPQTIPNATWTLMANRWGQLGSDWDAALAGADGDYTAVPATGLYAVSVIVDWQANDSGLYAFHLSRSATPGPPVPRSDTTVLADTRHFPDDLPFDLVMTASGLVRLGPSDQLYLHLYQETGDSITYYATPNNRVTVARVV